MTPATAVKLARLQAQFPYKSYSELCSIMAKRPRKRKAKTVEVRNIRLPYKD